MSAAAPSRLRVLYDIVLQVAGADALTAFRSAFAGSHIFLTKNNISRPLAGVIGQEKAFVVVSLYWIVLGRLGLSPSRNLYINSEELAFRCQVREEGLALIAGGSTVRAAAVRVGVSERTMQRAHLGKGLKVGTIFKQSVAENVKICSDEEIAIVEAALVKLRNARRKENRKKIIRLKAAGASRNEIMRAVGVSSATLSVYLSNLRRSGQIAAFRRGPVPGSKLDGSAWRERKAALVRAYDDGLSRDDIAARLGMGRRRLTRELMRLRRETGERYPLPWTRGAHTLGPARACA